MTSAGVAASSKGVRTSLIWLGDRPGFALATYANPPRAIDDAKPAYRVTPGREARRLICSAIRTLLLGTQATRNTSPFGIQPRATIVPEQRNRSCSDDWYRGVVPNAVSGSCRAHRFPTASGDRRRTRSAFEIEERILRLNLGALRDRRREEMRVAVRRWDVEPADR